MSQECPMILEIKLIPDNRWVADEVDEEVDRILEDY